MCVFLVGACKSSVEPPPPPIGQGGTGGVGGAGGAGVGAGGDDPGGGGQGGAETSSTSTVETIDLGSADSGQGEAVFTFTIDETTTSFSLSVTSSAPGSSVVFLELQGPSGVLAALGPGGQVMGPFEPLATSVGALPYGLLYPNTPSLSVEPGTYQASFAAIDETGFVPSTLSTTLFVKKAESPPTLGAFDLDLWIVENQFGFDAEEAQSDSLIQNAIASLREVYDNAGITIGDVAYRDLAAPQLAVIDDVAELTELLSTPDADRNGRMAVFLVEQIDLASQGTILGLSPGIPGPSFVSPAPHSGVVVSLLALDFGPLQLGETMAHEVGHFLGLRHTTESNGLDHDPIEDTPECESSGSFVSPYDCTHADGYNFMFWTSFDGPVSQSEVSPGQRVVMNSNPSVANDGP